MSISYPHLHAKFQECPWRGCGGMGKLVKMQWQKRCGGTLYMKNVNRYIPLFLIAGACIILQITHSKCTILLKSMIFCTSVLRLFADEILGQPCTLSLLWWCFHHNQPLRTPQLFYWRYCTVIKLILSSPHMRGEIHDNCEIEINTCNCTELMCSSAGMKEIEVPEQLNKSYWL